MQVISKIKIGLKNRKDAYRNPVYLAYSFVGILIFLLSVLIAASGVGFFETTSFRFFNNLPQGLISIFVVISLLGTIGMVFICSIVALLRHHYANSLRIILAGGGAYLASYIIKNWHIRSRPDQIISDVIVREQANSILGFPSGHAAVATVLALISYQYLPKKWHRSVTVLAGLVFISRLYLGVHFPIDLLGGFAIGLFFGSIFNFIFGSLRHSPVSNEEVKKRLNNLGYRVNSVKLIEADSRSSVPYLAKGDEGTYFIKIVGYDNTVADWLFKIFRRVVYRRLEDEQPYMSPKRQLEHEAYIAMLAYQAGVRTPRMITVFEILNGRWALAQEHIQGQSIDSIDNERLTESILTEIWQQVEIMHRAKIIHRDLRAANIVLDKVNKPWLVDFGFAEGSADSNNYYRDIVELIASLSLIVGSKKAIYTANKIIGSSKLKSALPYMSYSSLSSTTTKLLKKHKNLLKEIQQEMAQVSGVKDVKIVKMKRIDTRTLLIVVSLGLAVYILAPQFISFKESLNVTSDANIFYIVLGALLSCLTYVFAGLAYKFIAVYPLKTWPSVLVQLASSFTGKLVPAGTGSMALNGRFLYKNNHDPVQAGVVTAANTLLGFIGHISVILFVSIFNEESIAGLIPDIHISTTVVIVVILTIITILVSLKVFPAFKKFILKGKKTILEQIKYYANNKSKLLFGYFMSVLVTLGYSLTLFFCGLAVGINMSMLDVVYVFTIGSIATSITPTPGGLGGTEAALVASMTSIGVASSAALAITLIYRLLTFWLPIIPGFIAFQYINKKGYI